MADVAGQRKSKTILQRAGGWEEQILQVCGSRQPSKEVAHEPAKLRDLVAICISEEQMRGGGGGGVGVQTSNPAFPQLLGPLVAISIQLAQVHECRLQDSVATSNHLVQVRGVWLQNSVAMSIQLVQVRGC